MGDARLKPSGREFFVALDRVIYDNSFSDTRAQIIQRLVPSAVSAERRIDQKALRRMVEVRQRTCIDVDAINRLNTEGRYQTIIFVAAAMPACVSGFGMGESRTALKTALVAYPQNHGRQQP